MICGLDVKIVTLKQVKKVIWKHTYKFTTKEWYITDVTNVVMKHAKSKPFTNTCRNMYENRRVELKYNCSACDYKATSAVSLKLHKQVKHEGFRYACGECGHQVTSKQSLKSHMTTKHGGEKISCDECIYQSAFKQSLKLHTQSKHDGLRYACGECGYKAITKCGVKLHTQSKHGGIG